MGGVIEFFKADSISRWATDDSIARKLRHAFANSRTGNDKLAKIYNTGNGARMINIPEWKENIADKKYSKTIFVDVAELRVMLERKVLDGHVTALTFFFDEKEAEDTRLAISESVEARHW